MLKQNPFSFYDFLGYLIPGGLMIYFVIILTNLNLIVTNPTLFYESISKIDISAIFPLLLLAYLLGHILSYLSGLCIERYSIWTIGFPSAYLFKFKNHYGFFKVDNNKLPHVILRILNIIFLAPLVILDLFLGMLFGFRCLIAKPFNEKLQLIIIKKIINFVDEPDIRTSNELSQVDWFRLIYHYASEHSDTHFRKMQNYVALFGFTRTTTLIFNICFWIVLVLKITYNIPYGITLMLVFSFFTYLLYGCFNKFYRKYTCEALMAFNVTYTGGKDNELTRISNCRRKDIY